MKSTNFKTSALHLALLGAIALPLAGCGGNSSQAVKNLFGGKIIDGYVAGATVTLDTNDNRICEATEPQSPSDAAGNFSFETALGSHMVCSVGGTDLSTGKAFVGELKAPAGATAVTPLTNLIVASIPAGTVLTAANVAAAQATIATQLGLTAGTNLLTADPVALANAGSPALLQTTTAVQQLVQQTTAALTTATGTAATPATTNAIFQSVANAVAAQLAVAGSPVVNLASAAAANTFTSSVVSASVTSLQKTPVAGVTATNLNVANTAAVISSAVATTVQSIASAPSAAAINTASTAAVTTGLAAIAATVTANAASTTSPTAGMTNVVPVAGTSVNGTATVANAATATGGITNAAMTFGALVGAPVTTAPVSVSFAVTSTVARDARTFNGTISGLTAANTAGVLSITAPATATATLSGTHTNATSFKATQTGAALASWVAAPAVNGVGGGVQLNVGTILAAVNATAGFAGLNLLKGNFNVTVTVSGLQLSNAAATAITPSQTIKVTVN